MAKEFPVQCDSCEVPMEIKGSWVSGTGMAFTLYQCPECRDIDTYMADKPLKIEEGTCPRCGSENSLAKGRNNQDMFECPDCGLIFMEKCCVQKDAEK